MSYQTSKFRYCMCACCATLPATSIHQRAGQTVCTAAPSLGDRLLYIVSLTQINISSLPLDMHVVEHCRCCRTKPFLSKECHAVTIEIQLDLYSYCMQRPTTQASCLSCRSLLKFTGTLRKRSICLTVGGQDMHVSHRK